MIVALNGGTKSGTQVSSESVIQQGKGTHALNTTKELFSDKEKWFTFNKTSNNNFPGFFSPQQLGYCEDISILPNYEQW